MTLNLIETHPLAPYKRSDYVEHWSDVFTRTFATEAESLLEPYADTEPLKAVADKYGWWIAKLDDVHECITDLVGMPPNGLVSPYLQNIAGVVVWTEATWHHVPGLVVQMSGAPSGFPKFLPIL